MTLLVSCFSCSKHPCQHNPAWSCFSISNRRCCVEGLVLLLVVVGLGDGEVNESKDVEGKEELEVETKEGQEEDDSNEEKEVDAVEL